MRKGCLGFIVVLLALATIAFSCARKNREDHRQKRLERRDDWINKQIVDLKSGGNHINFYSTINTNVMLQRTAGMPEVESISFHEAIDLSEVGLKLLSTYPNLKKLSFYRTAHINDAAMTHIAKCSNLESLAICSTFVTEVGLQSLVKLQKLKKLRLLHNELSDIALKTIAQCKSLERFTYCEKFSPEALEEFQKQLPNCLIEQTEHPW